MSVPRVLLVPTHRTGLANALAAAAAEIATAQGRRVRPPHPRPHSPGGAGGPPADAPRLLDCPLVVVLECRGGGTGIRALMTGLKSHLDGLNLAGAVLSGGEDRDHCELLRSGLGEENGPVA